MIYNSKDSLKNALNYNILIGYKVELSLVGICPTTIKHKRIIGGYQGSYVHSTNTFFSIFAELNFVVRLIKEF